MNTDLILHSRKYKQKKHFERNKFNIVSPKRFDLESEAGFVAGEERIGVHPVLLNSFQPFCPSTCFPYKTMDDKDDDEGQNAGQRAS